MAGWANFFLAQVGASAALVGLIFVAVSINLTRILSVPRLPGRAFQALALLTTILVISSLLLIPDQAMTTVGIEVLIVGGAFWLLETRFDIQIYRLTEARFHRLYSFNLIFTQAAMLPYLVGGIVMATTGASGVGWLAFAVILSFLKAILDAWVLLIEINR